MKNNIKESYVTFEVSKLLKEKGFDVHCNAFYDECDEELHENVGNYNSEDQDEHCNHCSAPTTALTIKWIRENFGIHIRIDWFFNDNDLIDWDFCIQKIGTDIDEKGNGEYLRHYDLLISFDSSEETENAAILHTLNNLI